MILIMQKRAVSDVMATVIIIALVIVAVTVVWVGVLPLIKNKVGGSDVCNSVDVSIENSQGYTCWASDKNVTLVQIKKGPNDVNISKMKFAISYGGNSFSYTNNTILQKNSFGVYYLNTTGINGVGKIEVVPFVRSGNSEKACSSVYITNVKACSITLSDTEIAQAAISGNLLNQDTTHENGPTTVVNNPQIIQSGFSCNSQNGYGFFNGSGTLVSPFGICNCTMLQNMKNNLSANYSLLSNIDCSSVFGFVSVGNSSVPFSGNFNGNGNTISNLTINLPSVQNVGLFGYSSAGMISNVGLVGVNVTGYSNVGGLIGEQWGGVVYNSFVLGNVSGFSYNVGGLVGYVYAYSTVNNSYSSGLVSGSVGYAGGLAGQSDGVIQSSYSAMNVTGYTLVGGLVGYQEVSGAKINNSYAAGKVVGTRADYYGTVIGGVIGQADGGGVYNSYSVGNVSGKMGSSNRVGGFIGNNNGGVVGNTNYWDNITSGQSTSGGAAIGKITTDMKNPVTFSSWNINVWNLTNGFYPKLNWQSVYIN